MTRAILIVAAVVVATPVSATRAAEARRPSNAAVLVVLRVFLMSPSPLLVENEGVQELDCTIRTFKNALFEGFYRMRTTTGPSRHPSWHGKSGPLVAAGAEVAKGLWETRPARLGRLRPKSWFAEG